MGDVINYVYIQFLGKIIMRYLFRLFGEVEILENKGYWVIRKQGYLVFVKVLLLRLLYYSLENRQLIYSNCERFDLIGDWRLDVDLDYNYFLR